MATAKVRRSMDSIIEIIIRNFVANYDLLERKLWYCDEIEYEIANGHINYLTDTIIWKSDYDYNDKQIQTEAQKRIDKLQEQANELGFDFSYTIHDDEESTLIKFSFYKPLHSLVLWQKEVED